MNRTILISLSVGALIGVASSLMVGAFLWAMLVQSVQRQMLVTAYADQTSSLIPMLIAREEQDIERWYSAAFSQVSNGVIILDTHVRFLDGQPKTTVTKVLESIAAKRERLGLGRYSTPQQPRVEEVLVKYDRT